MIGTVARLDAFAPAPRRKLLAALASGVLATGFAIALVVTAGYLISRAAERPPILALTTTIVTVRFLGIARPLTRYVERLASHDLALRIVGRVRARFYQRIEPLAPAGIAAYRQGDLLSRMVDDVDSLQDLYPRGLAPPLIAISVACLCVALASALLPVAGAILAAGLLIAGVVAPALATALARDARTSQAAARADLSADFVEVLRGAPELIAFGHEQPTMERIRERNDSLTRLARRDALAAGVADGLVVLLTGLTTVAVLAIAVAAQGAGHLDPVLIATLGLLALTSFESVSPLPTAARDLAATLAAGERVLELTDRGPLVVDPAKPRPAPASPTVAIEDVTARYSRTEAVAVDHLDLRIEPGSRVALVGPSGAGKSTVAALLLRFLDPELGQVTIGGAELPAYSQRDVRANFALAGQEAHLFNASIAANLLLARPGASEEELWHVLEKAAIADWVRSLPLGMETAVGEESRELSGGQRQRLVVARALLADCPVLILDEPTAHLDDATAEALIADLFAAAADRSLLLITHRGHGLDRVDEILTLDEGRIVARAGRSAGSAADRASVNGCELG